MGVLHLDLGLATSEFLRGGLISLVFLVDLITEILDIFVDLAALAAHLFDLPLQPCNEGVKLLNLTVFVTKLPLKGAIVLGLALLSMLFETLFQLIQFFKGVPDLDLVLGLKHVADTFEFFCELDLLVLLLLMDLILSSKTSDRK